MKYLGKFNDINDKQYTIEIITNNDETKIQEVQLSENPFISEVEGSDNIFVPVKYSGATISLLVSNIIPDIYSSKAQGTKVILKEGDIIKWIGYVTPNMYDLNFNTEIEELQIEAIDGLSTLQYIDFTAEFKLFQTFSSLIDKILTKCNCYEYFYLPSTFQLNLGKDEQFFRSIWVSEANFFDEQGEPMKCDEVLEELCKFMGVTCIAEGDSVYFLDYEALRIDRKPVDLSLLNYYKVRCKDGYCQEYLVPLSDIVTINKDSYSASNTLISLGDTFNKVKVIDSLYSVDTVMPSLQDSKLLKNKNKDDYYEQRRVVYPIDANLTYNAFLKFYDHPNFKSKYYFKDEENGHLVPYPPAFVNSYTSLGDYVGGTIMKVFVSKEEFDNVKIPSLDWQTYIYIQNLGYQDGKIRPCISTKLDKELALNNKDTYILLEGSVNFSSRDRYIPLTDKEFGGDEFKKENLYIEAILRYGNLYFDGRSWNKSKVPFKINLECEDNDTAHLYNKARDFKSNIEYTMGLEDTSGLAIKLPSNELCTEAPEITFIQPRHVITNHASDDKLPYTGYWISGFDMKVEIARGNVDDVEDDTDTSYENVINGDYVNDFDDVEFKICTWDNKQANYSAVIYNDGVTLEYVDKIYNRATKDYARSEELYINRIIRQYSNPPLILNMSTYNNLHCYSLLKSDLFNKFFIINSQRINWRMNTNEVKLNEIKL